MPKRLDEPVAHTDELLQDLMIIHLGLAGVPQHTIRKIVKVDMNRVNRIVTLLKKQGKNHAKTKDDNSGK